VIAKPTEKKVEKKDVKPNFFGKKENATVVKQIVEPVVEVKETIVESTDYMDEEDSDDAPKSRISKSKNSPVKSKEKTKSSDKKSKESKEEKQVMSDPSDLDEETKNLKRKIQGDKEGTPTESEKKKKKEDPSQNKLQLVKPVEVRQQMVKKKIKTKDERGYTVYEEIEVMEDVPVVKQEPKEVIQEFKEVPTKSKAPPKKSDGVKPAGQSSLFSFFKK
jgi:hypothetical protein